MNTAFDLRHQWRREWRDLARQFLALRDSTDPNSLYALHLGGGHWALAGGSTDQIEREYVQSEFRSLGLHAGICAGAGFGANALDCWLNSLVGDGKTPAYIRAVIPRSAEKCQKFAISARAVAGGTPARLRRDSYPEWSWLYSHSHEPLADPKAEYDYWTAHIWYGYDALIDNYVFRGMSTWAKRHETMNSAFDGLSYDLAVLQANYVVDRGLRGEVAIRAYRDEAAELLNSRVTAAWRASCERLSITFDGQTVDGKDLTQAFQRVGDDLRQLIPNLPPAGGSSELTGSTDAVPIHTAAGPAMRESSRSVARRRYETGAVEAVRIQARKMLVEGATHRQVCERLKEAPRPTRAEWRHLSWDRAYKDERYRSAVCKWLSRNCRP